MLRRSKYLVAPVLALVLLTANLYVFSIHRSASAHNWGGYHLDKGGSAIYIYHYWAGGAYRADANAAMNDFWSKVGILYNYWVSSHDSAPITVWDGNYGATGWGGLAELTNLDWDWGCWCYQHIGHAHARYNSYYNSGSQPYRQGVFCQEIFHTYGFAHDNYGNCMGLGYYSGSDYRLNSHNNTDFYNRYRNH